MSHNIIADSNSNSVQEFDEWENVPKEFKTRNRWDLEYRAVKRKEEATAKFLIKIRRKFETIDKEVEHSREINLYHISQTRPVRKTDLKFAFHQFYEYFVRHHDRNRLIKICKGQSVDDGEGGKYWDDSIDKEGWFTFQQNLSFARCKDHIYEREIYGVLGRPDKFRNPARSYYLMIDLDLHNQTLEIFLARLHVLINRFHGDCHFQVSDVDAGGIHLWLFFKKLANNKKWLINQLRELHEKHPQCEFFKNDKLNIEIYPSDNKGHRLPLAKGRKMLLDKPLELVERRGKLRQDVVGYIRWLNDPNKEYMPKADVLEYIMSRLDLSKAKSENEKSEKLKATKPKSDKPDSSQSSNTQGESTDQKPFRMKNKTRGAIIGFWKKGEAGHFGHINSAIYTTLQAMCAEGVQQDDAVEIMFRYIDEIHNSNLSSRLECDLKDLHREVERTAQKVWNSWGTDLRSFEKWQAVINRWRKVGFRVSDKSTWSISKRSLEVTINCEEIEFDDDEKRLLIKHMVPLMVGKKQALKKSKQDIVINAVVYFLRYVKCCDREIPREGLPKILADFGLKLGSKTKRSAFFGMLIEWKWIYLRADYYSPRRYGRSGRGRARSFGIGDAMVSKFADLSKTKQRNNNGSIFTASHFLTGCRDFHDSEIEAMVTSFEDQI